mgnify:CR=1 FL=1|jgi:hypothetical protein
MGYNIILTEPETPINTSNLGRLSLPSGSRLNLVKLYGFELGFLVASSYSDFIKPKSGISPLALQREIRKIHEH